jgi:large subunit ribosomal protein L17
MIKNFGRRKLSRTGGHRRSLLRNLATSLFLHEKIETTVAKAKELRVFAEKLITAAKPLDLNAKKAIFADIQNKDVRKKIFEVIVPRYQERKGGYTQIFKTSSRVGDDAKMAIIKLIS